MKYKITNNLVDIFTHQLTALESKTRGYDKCFATPKAHTSLLRGAAPECHQLNLGRHLQGENKQCQIQKQALNLCTRTYLLSARYSKDLLL